MRDQALPIWEGHNAQDPTLMGFDLIELLRIFGVPNAGSPILKALVVKLVRPSSLYNAMQAEEIMAPTLPVLSSSGQVPTRRQHTTRRNGERNFYTKASSIPMPCQHVRATARTSI